MHNSGITLIKHPQYYYADGQIVFQCEGYLYRLYKGILMQKSKLFKAMLSLPQPHWQGGGDTTAGSTKAALDGATDETAINLSESHTSTEWDHLLSFLFPVWTGEERPVDTLIDILNLGSFYEVEEAREFAIQTLSVRQDFRPALRLNAARRNRILTWVEPAMRQLFQASLADLSDSDAKLIGPETLLDVACTKAKIETHRKRLALFPPKVVHSAYLCDDKEGCTHAWNTAWWGQYDRPGVAKAILQLQKPLPGREVVERVQAINVEGMTFSCKRQTLENLQKEHVKGMFSAEDRLIQNVIDHIYKHLEQSM
ncbi:hypothetical protein GLOTRDRAFT_134295 [Gloeophyllum trabeum ATCC 11539]|uniref:BTB domain-containing protein n=1 Tax=Gloeophyllum trabeum (strain ATCC 11539 / FP-39264 / Madison 617) TaxID=670483 RepID=S7PQH9_GLOTA|nr:uncharacterized protein GLOTRDRAFT_134295 [Gloeophyllum trabeum ATCC 11539]EPQ50061.1 hypothetical protein GLOTRDRAFT_134295 [Gloeophyllum trabeum ATCC 11539]